MNSRHHLEDLLLVRDSVVKHTFESGAHDALARVRVLDGRRRVDGLEFPHELVNGEAEQRGHSAEAVPQHVPAEERAERTHAHAEGGHHGGGARLLGGRADRRSVVDDAEEDARQAGQNEHERRLPPTVLLARERVVLPHAQHPDGRPYAHHHGAGDLGGVDGGRVHQHVQRAHDREHDDGDARNGHVLHAHVVDVGGAHGAEARARVAWQAEPAGKLQAGELGDGAVRRVDGGHGARHHHQVDEGEGGRAERARDGCGGVEGHAVECEDAVDADRRVEDDEHRGDASADEEGSQHRARAREEGAVGEHRVVEGIREAAL
mmetsp:Transcript_16899/g.43198  ORF Transcript_16899/g.43198 Transcript_16899/m.43198 type:complete len:320 (-) Transcript_16899:905-1864(-)